MSTKPTTVTAPEWDGSKRMEPPCPRPHGFGGGHPAPERHGSSLALSLYGGQQRAISLATAQNSGFPPRLPVTTRIPAISRYTGWKPPAG